jgi:Tfp pilus assembly protein PilO
MAPALFLRQLWGGYRWPLLLLTVLILANVAVALLLQLALVPTVTQRERLLISRQSEQHGEVGTSPVEQFINGERQLAAFHERIPAHREFTGLIVELQGMAGKAGLELDQISYQHERDQDNALLRYQLTFTVNGPYRAIKQFVHTLEQSPRLIIIQQVGLQGADQPGGSDVRLQLNLDTFFRPGTS